jgi:hypothetical protein
MGSAEGAKDDELIGLQRRYDDEMKRRLVKRIAPKFFKGCTTAVLASDPDTHAVRTGDLFASSHEGLDRRWKR